MLSSLHNQFSPASRALAPRPPLAMASAQASSGTAPGMGLGMGSEQGQMLKALAATLLSNLQGIAGAGGEGCRGGCPVNFGSWGEGGGGNSTPAPNSNSHNSNTGSPNVTINAKKIKNSNIIVNGENVTATAGKKNNKA